MSFSKKKKKEWKLDEIVSLYQMVCVLKSWCFVLFVQWVKKLDLIYQFTITKMVLGNVHNLHTIKFLLENFEQKFSQLHTWPIVIGS